MYVIRCSTVTMSSFCLSTTKEHFWSLPSMHYTWQYQRSCLFWTLASNISCPVVSVTSRWRDDWQSATVLNSSLVEDSTIWLSGFDLHQRQWSLLNRFRTGQGHCNACRKKWGFTDNELCDCGETQTMSHIVNSCPLTKFDGGLPRLHKADEAAANWLTTHGS